MKFRKGDTVKRINYGYGALRIGDVVTVESVLAHNRVKIVGYPENLLSENFSLVRRARLTEEDVTRDFLNYFKISICKNIDHPILIKANGVEIGCNRLSPKEARELAHKFTLAYGTLQEHDL